jgi:osmotically-inducible protein OsmY
MGRMAARACATGITGELKESPEGLDLEPSVDAANIGVAVENGIVTLACYVASYAERAVQRVRGVRGTAEEIEKPQALGTIRDDLARQGATPDP